MDAEIGFLIDGKVYEVPTLESLTLDESELLYERCGIVQEDFAYEVGEDDDEHAARIAKLMRHPGFMASLVQIAYQRGNPTAKPAQVHLVLKSTNRLEAFSTLGAQEEEPDDVPLAPTSEPSAPSSSGSLGSESSTGDSSGSSGSDSTNGSEGRASDLARIGPTRLDTSSTSGLKEPAVSGYPI